jgi:hypothetical protein
MAVADVLICEGRGNDLHEDKTYQQTVNEITVGLDLLFQRVVIGIASCM